MFLHYCMHIRTCEAKRRKQAANYRGPGAGPNKGSGWFILPRVVSDSQFWTSAEGRRIVSLKVFFSWHREAKREGALSDHKSYDYRLLQFFLQLSLFFHMPAHTRAHALTHLMLPCVGSRRPSWKALSFPRRRWNGLFSQNWRTDSVLDCFRISVFVSLAKSLLAGDEAAESLAAIEDWIQLPRTKNCAKHQQQSQILYMLQHKSVFVLQGDAIRILKIGHDL